MIDRETEFRNAFYFCKRWAKSPLTISYTFGYSSGLGDRDPAQKVHDYIGSLQRNKVINFEEKLNNLYKFLEESEKTERKMHHMDTVFYNNLIRYINRSKKDISEGKSVQKKRL